MSDSPQHAEEKPSSEGKKAYTPPTLTEYGNVSKLTMTKGSTTVEITANMRRGCL